ncbi:MAG TPA: hypothetical protein VF765_23960 [Polyangiaceae bacterium]
MDPPDAAQSPQASAEPTPLVQAAANAAGNAGANTDGGAVPEPMRADRELTIDVPRETSRELLAKDPARDPKELAGYQIDLVVHAGEGPAAVKGPEVNALAIEAARHKTEARITVQASQSRARFVFQGGFVLPPGTELRARVDRFGHLLFWPTEQSYRVVEPGALRALLGERRLDVAPQSRVQATPAGDGARRLNVRTRRVELATRAGKATLELGAFRDAGDGGALVCRFLVDLMGGTPAGSPCATDELPLHAEIRWSTQGTLVVDAVDVTRRSDLAVADLAAPPPSTWFATGLPPGSEGDALLPRGELAAIRNGPVDVPPAPAADGGPPPPESGLFLANLGDAPRFAWIDGVAAAWVASGGRVALPSLLRGRYVFQWRTPLGDGWEPPQTVTAPGRVELASPDVATR